MRAGLGKEVILDADFSYDFSLEGNVLPILGESGIGKSTLLYVLAALAKPRAGEVTWCETASGQRIRFSVDANQAERRDGVAFRRFRTGLALQDAALVPHLTVRENLEWILRQRGAARAPDDGNTGSRAQHARAQRVAAAVAPMLSEDDRETRLHEILDKFPSTLSGGERLRMALAAAMIHDPPILFTDEPTGSLDTASRERILAHIRQWVRDGNGQRSLVIITHQEEEATYLAARKCLRVARVKGAPATARVTPVKH